MAASVSTLLLALPASQAGSNSGAGGEAGQARTLAAQLRDSRGATRAEASDTPAAPEHCTDARRAVAYYRAQAAKWRRKMGAGEVVVTAATPSGDGGPRARVACPRIRYLAERWRERARAARRAYRAWWTYHYAWWRWLPANWAALGACETGYGRRPGNWHHDSGTYVSAFGLYRPNYQNGAARTRTRPWRSGGPFPTPREQYEVALSHYRVYGDGWGCPGP